MTSAGRTSIARAFVAVLAGVAIAGCSSHCGTNCPNLEFDVVATVGDNLNVATATWTGDACPTDTTPQCRGDFDGTHPCVRFTILARTSGSCQLALTFTDGRYPFVATASFGPETHQGCCHGFPVTGPAVATIPPLHPPIGFDASPDVATGEDAAGGDADSD